MSDVPLDPPLVASPGELGRWLEERLGRGLRASQIVAFSIEAPTAAPERWLATADDADAFAWLPPGEASGPRDATWVGSGATLVLTASGPDRLAEIRARAEGAGRCIDLGGGRSRARFFGGIAFAPGDGALYPWEALGDACFVLPRLAYERRQDRARLHIAVPADELSSRADRRQLVDEVATRFARLSLEGRADVEAPPRRVLAAKADRERFLRRVAELLVEIRGGRLEKVVTAESAELSIEPAPDVVDVLLRLREETAATRFAFRRNGACFLGASPELLVRREGLEVATEAVAGSVRADAPDAAQALLSSPKDQREHALVVEALVRAISPLVERLSLPEQPCIRRLNRLMHLLTPMQGRLLRRAHVLELVERLHPTPAVGGTPREGALAAIGGCEALPRGWYAAPFGWFDGDGDGVFAVGLRSALLRGASVHLFAGAGIVSDSDPEQEYEEIGAKLATMRRALGVHD